MIDLQLHLQIIGWMFLLLSIIHVMFSRFFEWKADLSKLTLINKQMMYVHTFFIALLVLLNGIFFIMFSHELVIPDRLPRAIITGFLIFWGIRCLVQHFYYSPLLWRGKRFETTVHVLFSIFWGYVIFVFVMILNN